MAEVGNYTVCAQSAQPSSHRGIKLPNAPGLVWSNPSPRGWHADPSPRGWHADCIHSEVPTDATAPQVPRSQGGALATFSPMQAELPRNLKSLVDNHAEILGPPIDAVGDETDSDGRDNGDLEEVEPFIPVVGGRTINSSRSASISSGSLTPPTPITLISNAFEVLSSIFQCHMH